MNWHRHPASVCLQRFSSIFETSVLWLLVLFVLMLSIQINNFSHVLNSAEGHNSLPSEILGPETLDHKSSTLPINHCDPHLCMWLVFKSVHYKQTKLYVRLVKTQISVGIH